MKTYPIAILLITNILLFSCQKAIYLPENTVFVYTQQQGFTGKMRSIIVGTSLKYMQNHSLAKNAEMVKVSPEQIQEILQVFEKEKFEEIQTQQIAVNDRGGVQIEMIDMRYNIRYVKSNIANNWIVQADQSRFKACQSILEKYIPLYPER